MPKNVVQLTRPGFRPNRLKYRVCTTKWGILGTNPPAFADEWQRLRGVAKALKLSRDARKRLEWILWYESVGKGNARATCRHFGIAPKVFYFWKKRFSSQNLRALEDRSHRPHRVRHSTLTGQQMERIADLRRKYLHYSKMKLAILYREMHGEPISSWKIQQVISRFRLYPNVKRAENTAAKRRRAWKKKRITELRKKPHPGFLFGIDTVVRHFDGQKRYILTAIDRHSRFAFARMYKSHSSLTAADFLHRLHEIMGGKLVHIQTDNGSEFHLHFEKAINELKLTHWWSRVKTPKDNAVCERFNRTLQEEFIGQGNGHSDVDRFNHNLMNWLVEYDYHRPHTALGYRRPIEIAAHLSTGSKVLPINPSHTASCAVNRRSATLRFSFLFGARQPCRYLSPPHKENRMDPQTTWDQLLSALADGDWDRAEELVSALTDWLARDGFPPTVLGIAALGPEFDRALAKAACDFIHAAIVDRSSAAPTKGADS